MLYSLQVGFLPVGQVPDVGVIKKGLKPFKINPRNFKFLKRCNGIVVFCNSIKKKVVIFAAYGYYAILLNQPT